MKKKVENFQEKREIIQGEFRMMKLQNIDFLAGIHTERIETAYSEICKRADEPMQEEVRQLAEMTYREGILDGMHLYSQIVDEIY